MVQGQQPKDWRVFDSHMIGNHKIVSPKINPQNIVLVRIQKDYNYDKENIIHLAIWDPTKEYITLKKIDMDEEINEPCYCLDIDINVFNGKNIMWVYPEITERSIIRIVEAIY